jgi:hypothetical protein
MISHRNFAFGARLLAGVNKSSPNVEKKIIQKLTIRFQELMDLS